MIIEIVFKSQPSLEFEGYEKIEFSAGTVFANPVQRKIGIVLKKHHDGRFSVFTDNSDVIESIVSSSEVIDIHVK